MSTKMSNDFILERSSTRLHAPPGGKTSICFGTYEEPKPVQRNVPVSLSSIISHQNIEQPSMNSSRRGVPASSMASILAHDDTPTSYPAKKSNDTMSSIISQENMPNQVPQRRRQAPGGTSSIVLG